MRLVGATSAAFGILQAEAFALGLQDVAAVREPIQGRSCQPFAAQHFGPVLTRSVILPPSVPLYIGWGMQGYTTLDIGSLPRCSRSAAFEDVSAVRPRHS